MSDMEALERSCAQIWDMPDIMIEAIENPRRPFTAPLAKIVGETVTAHIDEGSVMLEVGAGSGYLKDLLPATHRGNLISSDYNPGNLRAGLGRRSLAAIACSAYELPLRDAAADCVLDLDAFDTLPSLDRAVAEAARALKPGGKFIHFQINIPSEDMLDHDYPDVVWLPQVGVTSRELIRHAAGVKREELLAALEAGTLPGAWDRLMRGIMEDTLQRHRTENDPQADTLIQIVNEITRELGLSQVLIPSIAEYFRAKLEKSAVAAGLTVLESGYKKESCPVDDGGLTEELVMGKILPQGSTRLVSEKTWRSASMMVFVAQKQEQVS